MPSIGDRSQFVDFEYISNKPLETGLFEPVSHCVLELNGTVHFRVQFEFVHLCGEFSIKGFKLV